jgi:hypothetical protein
LCKPRVIAATIIDEYFARHCPPDPPAKLSPV